MTTQIISPTGQKNYAFGVYVQAQAYRLGDSVIYNGSIYTANGNIPANTPFAEGTTGATWSTKIIGIPTSGLPGISNGTSNIAIPTINGNVNTSVGGVSNVLVVTTTGANVIGTVTATGNITGGNLVTSGVLNVTGTGVSSIAGNLDMTSNNIINLATPVNANDAVTKQYVDDIAQGLHTHDSCDAATNTTLAIISGGTVTYNNGASGLGANLVTTGSYTTIDGVTLSVGMRVLVKNEANAAHNGIYDLTSATVLTRSTDFDTPAEMAGGDFTFVTAGTLYDNTGWVMTGPVTPIGTSLVNWVQFSGAGTFTAGTGLTLTGTQFSITNTAVTAASYGNGDRVATFSVNGQGQLTAAANTVIASNAANLTGTTLASSIVTSSLTTVGTLGTLNVTGNANVGNLGTGGLIVATGNVTGGNLVTTGAVSAGTLSVTGVSNLNAVSNVTITGGNAGQYLQTNGAGMLTWADASAGVQTTDPWISQVEDTIGNPIYPTTLTWSGTTRQASTEAELISAISASSNGDIVELTANITLTATLVINKEVKITGGFTIQSAGTSSDPVTLISVTAAAHFDNTITIDHRKTTNTTVETAVNVNVYGFVSEATVKFMEFGYVLRGSFLIGGKTIYTGALGNTHRHIAIYNLSAPSHIQNVEFDFPQEATARANLISILSAGSTDIYDAILKVSGCYHDLSKYCRQFLFIETLLVTAASRNASLWVDNCNWDDLNGGIGMLDSTQSPFDSFTAVVLYKNSQGMAGYTSYKGLMFVDGSGSVRSLGEPTFLAIADNSSPQTLRADYSPAIMGAIAYKNTVYTLPTTFKVSFGQFNTFGSTSGFAIGYRDVPQVTVAANATFALTDAGKHYYNTTAANFTLTVPNNSSVAFSTGSAITVVNQSANTLTIAQGTGVTMYLTGNSTSGNRTLGSYGIATLMKVGSDTWFVNGTGVV